MRYTTRIIVPPRVRRSGAPGTPGAGPRPQVLGVRKSFGFGDRLGVATPGHAAVAAQHSDFAPFFAQQSPGEMEQTGRTPKEILGSAIRSLAQTRYRGPWGADADRLRSPQEVEIAAEAGFTFFTFDPCEFVRPEADALSPDELATTVAAMVDSGELPEDWCGPYLDRTIELGGNPALRLTLDPLRRAAIKFGRAILHCSRMAEALVRASGGRSCEIEVSLDSLGAPVTALEHLFIGLELEARGVRLTSIALRFAAPFDEGVEYAGDPIEFENSLRTHAAVAEFCGPYKLGFHRVSYKPSVYGILARVCGDALHLKTSGASYLEALRVVMRTDGGLFSQIAEFCRSRFEEDRSSAGSAPSTGVGSDSLPRPDAGNEEADYFDQAPGRQVLLATCGSVLSLGADAQGRPFKTAILALLDQHADMYEECLVRHFTGIFQLLDER